MPGRWRTERVPPARGPMMAVTESGVKKITVMGPTQLLKTELINNIVGYFCHQDPAPMIVMQPTGSLAEAWSKDRLDKMVRDTPVLNELIKSKKSRDSDNTILHKSFPGGHITIVGSNSPSELASRPVRITLRDEVDKYPDSAGDEGDPSALLAERSATFWNSLDVGVCSPTIKGRSKIEKEYLNSDQRKFMVDCPHCGQRQVMDFYRNVKFENRDASTAVYICHECTVAWTEKERLEAIRLASLRPDFGYVATAPFKGHAGFHVNKLASPWEPLTALVQKWLDAQGDIEKIKTFKNTQLAETFEIEGEAPEYMRLYERREHYEFNTCPKGVVFLTAGCDVQKDRLEVSIYGWGRRKESWLIDHRVIPGMTHTEEPWLQLDRLLQETWTLHNGIEIQLKVLAVDSGYNTQNVYSWARKHVSSRVLVVKGRDDLQTLIGSPSPVDVTHLGTKVRRGIKVWPVGTNKLKEEFYSFLYLNGAGDDGIYPPGYCHYPQENEHFFKMLTAEQLITSSKKSVWVKKYERNEALDCRNYARAAAAFVGIDRFKEQDWLNFEGVGKPEEPSTQEQKKPSNKPVIKPIEPNKFWNNRGRKGFW